ncbi:hypothetical protein ACGYLO_12745 [Sulfitobacter sp. 1A13353]|uniref:hypothetical protein n=1 Tax=Sulfitobacter sp. 1A13353 TaxID=3368568 RepID=UPI0037473DCF
MKFVSSICSALMLFSLASGAQATDCSEWAYFSSSEEFLEPLSVPAKKIGKHLTVSEYSDDVVFSSRRRGKDVWLDIEDFPATSPAIAATRALMMAGRLMDENFERLVLEDDGNPIFAINEPELREIGCQFIWAREGGQNPLALMRELYQAMVWYEGGRPLSDQWNGSLLGDTGLAAKLSTEVLMPEWAMSAVELE